MAGLKSLKDIDIYNRPTLCKKCGGVMVFKGVGEYKCEECGELDYDDYGKVRAFIERHQGATAAEVEANTGVSQKTIRHMLKESRLEIAHGSAAYLKCEICGTNIRSGRFCPKCELEYHRRREEEQRKLHKNFDKGFGMAEKGAEGEKRFKHDRF